MGGTVLLATGRADATSQKRWHPFAWWLLFAALSLLTLVVQGYHPLAEDGGLYVAGVEFTLNPSLFPHYTAFVREHLRFSIFAPTVAALVHLTHWPLAWVLFGIEIGSLWLTFYSARQILRRCFRSNAAQLAGLSLLAVWATLPIAGTSLFLMDPYVTARSISCPLSLLGIAFALDDWRDGSIAEHVPDTPTEAAGLPGSFLGCVFCLVLAGLFHPLMGAYGFATIMFLRGARSRRRVLTCAALALLAVIAAAALHALAPAESPAVVAVTYTRYYWFLSQWKWFELFGLAGPLLILSLLLRAGRQSPDPWAQTAAVLCRGCIALGLTAVLVALLFAHESGRTHLVARLQPLRVFLLIYAIMTLLLGGALAEAAIPTLIQARQRSQSLAFRAAVSLLPAFTLVVLGAIMFSAQRRAFPASQHLELPWRAAHNLNPWSQAFRWAGVHTPPDALFALDAKYINEHGEDAQTFRATALRSALPDFSKDGGEASITPSLAGMWQRGATAQEGLSTEPDAVRDARLRPFSVTWMVLHSSAPTSHPCPYDNGTVKVCRLIP